MTTVVTPAGTSDRDDPATIEAFLDTQLRQFVASDTTRDMAKADAASAADATIGVREKVLTALAGRAHKANWSFDDAKEALERVIANYKANDAAKASSAATFKSDMLASLNRNVRGQVATIFQATRDAFDAETEVAKALKTAAEKRAVQPIHTAYSRSYHAAIAVIKAIPKPDNRFTIATPADVTAFAVEFLKSRRIDYKRVMARLAAIRGELESFYGDFPEDGISMCVEYLKEIDEKQLRQARADMERRNAAEDAEDTSSTPAPAPVATPQVESAPQSTEELLDAALADFADAA